MTGTEFGKFCFRLKEENDTISQPYFPCSGRKLFAETNFGCSLSGRSRRSRTKSSAIRPPRVNTGSQSNKAILWPENGPPHSTSILGKLMKTAVSVSAELLTRPYRVSFGNVADCKIRSMIYSEFKNFAGPFVFAFCGTAISKTSPINAWIRTGNAAGEQRGFAVFGKSVNTYSILTNLKIKFAREPIFLNYLGELGTFFGAILRVILGQQKKSLLNCDPGIRTTSPSSTPRRGRPTPP